jgi:hypothetical protein
MSSSLSAARPLGLEEGGYVVRTESSSSIDALPYHESSTRSLTRMTRSAMLPLLFGLASIGTPAVPGLRRVFSAAAISQSAFAGGQWLLGFDGLYFTDEPADVAEVRALNALLHLPTTSGLELDLPE